MTRSDEMSDDWTGPRMGDVFVSYVERRAFMGRPTQRDMYDTIKRALRQADDGAFTITDSGGNLAWVTWSTARNEWVRCQVAIAEAIGGPATGQVRPASYTIGDRATLTNPDGAQQVMVAAVAHTAKGWRYTVVTASGQKIMGVPASMLTQGERNAERI